MIICNRREDLEAEDMDARPTAIRVIFLRSSFFVLPPASPAILPSMPEPHLTLAAHLLLWGFPLALVIFVIAGVLRESRTGRERT
jgi:hypothetical protein